MLKMIACTLCAHMLTHITLLIHNYKLFIDLLLKRYVNELCSECCDCTLMSILKDLCFINITEKLNVQCKLYIVLYIFTIHFMYYDQAAVYTATSINTIRKCIMHHICNTI